MKNPTDRSLGIPVLFTFVIHVKLQSFQVINDLLKIKKKKCSILKYAKTPWRTSFFLKYIF